MGQYKLTTDVLPRLNDLGEPAGALVLQQKASAVTIDEHGIITEASLHAAITWCHRMLSLHGVITWGHRMASLHGVIETCDHHGG